MRKAIRLALLGMMVVMTLSMSSAIVVHGQDENVLVIAFEQEPPNLWPLNNLTFGGVLESMYARDLWGWDYDRNIYPIMATEIPSVENGMVTITEEGDTAVTVTLREGMVWSDGTPIVAADCEVWHTIRSDVSTSTNVSRDRYPDVVKSFELSADDPMTFTLTYAGTFPDYATASERPQCRYPGHIFGPMIADGGILEDSPYFTGGMDFNGVATVSYGPYVLETWDIGSSVTLVKNPLWDGQEAYYDRIVVPFISDSAQMLNALEQGEVDVTFNWTEDLNDEYSAIENVSTFAVPGVYSDALWVRMGETGNDDTHGGTALMDPLVRQALAYAVDRVALAEELVGPGITVPTSWYPEVLWPADLPFIEYDLDMARQLLDEAGWVVTGDPLVEGGDGLRAKDGVFLDNLRFVTTENALRNNYQLFIQDDLAQVGIGTDIQIIPATTLFASYGDGGTLTTYQWELAIFANSANALSPTSYSDYKCDGFPSSDNPDGFNGWQFCDPRYDELDALISTTLPGAERDAYVAEAVTRHFEGYFWHGLRLRAQWFAVDATAVDPALAEEYNGSLETNWLGMIEYWAPSGM